MLKQTNGFIERFNGNMNSALGIFAELMTLNMTLNLG